MLLLRKWEDSPSPFMRMDDELKKYYDAPCYSPYYAKGSVGTVVKAEGADEDELIEEEEENVVTEITRSKSGVLEELNGEDTRNMLIYVCR